MSAQEQQKIFLQQLASTGWQDSYAQTAPSMQYPEAVDDLIQVFQTYWQTNPTLHCFSNQINGIMTLDLSEAARNELIKRMNRMYIHEQAELPETLAECYDELIFWDLCPMKSVMAHFDQVADRFCEILKEHPAITPEVKTIILNETASPQMQKLRDHIISILRESMRGHIAIQVSPAARLDSFLLYATGDCGSYLISDSMWKAALKTAIQSSHTGANAYVQTRQAIVDASNTQILDRPRVILDRLADFLTRLDETVHYGRNFEADVMLPYWRSMSFQPITDSDLLQIYSAFLMDFPNGGNLIKQDISILKSSGHQNIIPQVKDLINHGPTKAASSTSGNRNDGYHDRFSKEKHASEAQSSKRFIWGGLALVAVLLIITVLLQFTKNDTPTEPSPSISAEFESAIPEETEKIENNREVEETQAPATEQPEQTKEPEEETTTSTPEPTAKPTESPTPTPTEAPTPEATEEATTVQESDPEPDLEAPVAYEETTVDPNTEIIIGE